KTTFLSDWIYGAMYSGSSQNVFFIDDPELDRLILKQRATFDAEARRDLLRQIWDREQDLVYRVGFPYHPKTRAVSAAVRGFVPTKANWWYTFGAQAMELTWLD